jgi:glucosyl-3-phosphoglycerate synthase
MSDFFHNGDITTLHLLKKDNIEYLESDLCKFSKQRPIALILPSIYDEIKGEALPKIINDLCEVDYLNEIIVTMGRTNYEQFMEAKRFFSKLPQRLSIIWNTGPRIEELYNLLRNSNIMAGGDEKGRSVWMAVGYVLARGTSSVIALHDCDIVTYDRGLLARLCYPVVNPILDYEYCKGFYARFSNKFHGRVTRLFVIPLVRSLKLFLGNIDYLEFINSFRYPLAGEFCFDADLGRIIRFPNDWGLEIGLLGEIYRNCNKKRICQSELADRYDHKHQPIGDVDVKKGLSKMSIDIIKTILKTLTGNGVIFLPDFDRTLKAAYLRTATDYVAKYAHDAEINGLEYDRHEEENMVDIFVKCVIKGVEEFFEYPLELPYIPNWNRVFDAIPDFGERLISVVDEDAKEK